MADYVSDHTLFMRDWMAKNQQERDVQKTGRALWWDKGPQDAETVKRLAEARVPRKAYYYDAN
ncbi:MAG TPA: DUF3460 family protein [Rhodocyclaceae bacterium]